MNMFCFYFPIVFFHLSHTQSQNIYYRIDYNEMRWGVKCIVHSFIVGWYLFRGLYLKLYRIKRKTKIIHHCTTNSVAVAFFFTRNYAKYNNISKKLISCSYHSQSFRFHTRQNEPQADDIISNNKPSSTDRRIPVRVEFVVCGINIIILPYKTGVAV